MMSLLRSLLGIGADELAPGQMALRAVLTFVVTMAVVRLGHKRLLGKATAFDFVVSIMVGTVMGRAITQAKSLLAIWLAGFTLIAVHWLVATLALRFHWFGPIVKGRPNLLIEDGHVHHAAMRKSGVSFLDLEEAFREKGHEPDLSRVRMSYLERDGSISLIPQKGEPRILEITVESNVQVVKVAVE